MRRALLVAALLLAACKPTAGDPPVGMRVAFQRLVPLTKGHYAVWVRTADADRLAGRFHVAETYMLQPLEGDLTARPHFVFHGDPAAAKEVFVTQEPDGPLSARPGPRVFLRGPVAPGTFALKPPVEASAAIPAPAGWQLVDWGRFKTLELAGPRPSEPGPLRPDEADVAWPEASVSFETQP